MELEATDRDTVPGSGSENRYIVLLLVLTGVLMSVVDGSVVSIALPTITEYFRVNIAQSQMIMTSYLVTITSLLLVFGKVAERVGKAAIFHWNCPFHFQLPGLWPFHQPEDLFYSGYSRPPEGQ